GEGETEDNAVFLVIDGSDFALEDRAVALVVDVGHDYGSHFLACDRRQAVRHEAERIGIATREGLAYAVRAAAAHVSRDVPSQRQEVLILDHNGGQILVGIAWRRRSLAWHAQANPKRRNHQQQPESNPSGHFVVSPRLYQVGLANVSANQTSLSHKQ